MAKDQHNDPKKPNILALSAFMLKGELVVAGEVISKKSFPNKGDWQNLCHMEPARAEETDEKVGKPKAEKTETPKKKKAGAPG